MTAVDGRLADWLATRLAAPAGDIRIDGLERAETGHSAETVLLTIVCGVDRREVAVRIRPTPPGLLEPYDLGRQFAVLQALEPTPVRAPRPLWYEPTGTVLGQEFYVMERLYGTVYERSVPPELRRDPDLVGRMCESMIAQIAAIHTVDVHAGGLASLGDGRGYLERELDHWTAEMHRVKRSALPALERLAEEVRRHRPEQSEVVTLVHGDAKPGNFAFRDGQVTAVFDWEMADVGDPRADLGWAEILWSMPNAFTNLPGAPSGDQLVARWEELTGWRARHREWFRAFQAFKMAVILLVGGFLYDAGHSDDRRLADMTLAIAPLTVRGLAELGIEGDLDAGPIRPGRLA